MGPGPLASVLGFMATGKPSCIAARGYLPSPGLPLLSARPHGWQMDKRRSKGVMCKCSGCPPQGGVLGTFWKLPSQKPLLRTLFYCKTHKKGPLLKTPSPEPFPEPSQKPSSNAVLPYDPLGMHPTEASESWLSQVMLHNLKVDAWPPKHMWLEMITSRAKSACFKVGACAMTTKFLDVQICTFKILLSWRFPRERK